ncbi:MAG: AAA family ATPase, partial [Gemmatimonadetes bacterium]|nr:AAA family ATPase [Gemmatimonadota bacterium]
HLTDNYGRVIDFKNTVIIMTSNLGARDIFKGKSMGFHEESADSSYDIMQRKVRDEIERAFNPEFLNRVDDAIVFHPLTREHISAILDIVMSDLRQRLAEDEMSLQLMDAAVGFLVDHGYDENFGARPLKRAVQRYVEDPLSEKILTREFSPGDEIKVDLDAEGKSHVFRAKTATTT